MMQSIAIILICIIVKLYDCSAVAVTADDTDNDDHHNHQHDSRRTEWPMPAVVGAASFVHDQRTSVNTQMLDESSQPNKHDKTVMNQITTLNNVNDSGNRIHYNQPSDGNVDNNFDVTQWRSIGANRIRRENDRRQDICDTICVCRNEENFLTVECNFQQHYTLSASEYFVNPSATSILIKLSADAQFMLDGRMFDGSNLNRISIEGTGSRKPHGTVEIHSMAFYGIRAPFPEIDILNVHSAVIQNGSFFGEFKLNVINCTKVWIYGDSFATSTFHGHFERINDLVIHEKAFAKSTGKILITNCRIDEVQRLDAVLKEIKFSESTVDVIRKGAFDVLNLNSIVFENCLIRTIERRAFTEKLYSNNFALIGCTIGEIETEAIMGSGIKDVILQQNHINFIKQRAILVTAVNTFIENNTINFLERFWFGVNDWSNVTVQNNHFGDYQQMAIEYTKNPSVCVFDNNFITKTSRNALNFKDPRCRVKQVSFSVLCSCDSSFYSNLGYNDLRSELYCRIDETLTHCFNATLFNVLAYEREICDDKTDRINCIKNGAHTKPNGSFIDLNLFKHKEKMFYIYVGIAAIAMIVGIALVWCLIRLCVRRHRKHIDDDGPMSDVMLTESLQRNALASTLKPSAPTLNRLNPPFTRSDLEIIHRTLQMMKQKYPPEIYDQVHNNTTKLISGNLTESDKVLTIGEIIRNLVECENTGTDFVAFTDVLYNHLDSTETHVTHPTGDCTPPPPFDPIYFEPANRMHRHGIDAEPLHAIENGYAIPGPTAPSGEHIYAEPIHLQQPLLRNEYTVPIDRSDSVSNLYTEPIARAIENDRWSSLPRPQNKSNVTGASTSNAIAASTPANEQNFMHLYAQPSTSRQFKSSMAATPAFSASVGNVTGAAASSNSKTPKNLSQLDGDTFTNSPHASSQESNNSHSQHSGGSGATLPLDDDDDIDDVDDPIDYADA